MFTPSQIARLNSDFASALSTTQPGRPANLNTPPLPQSLDAPTFGQNTRRLGNLFNVSAGFRQDVATNATLHDTCVEIFKETGDYWLSTAQMIDLGSGSKAQPLHADAAGWWPFWSMGDTWTPEFAVNFLIATTDTTKANGATGVVRGSHKIKYTEIPKAENFTCWDFPDEQVEQVELKAGDCLLLGGRIVHRGEENKTDERRGLLSVEVISSAFTPEEAHPLVVEEQARRDLAGMDERVKKFVGFREMKSVVGPGSWQDHRDLMTVRSIS
ncbi:phytanoyl-CoA dioxygenase [Periconia macrospinosa]|uniref:Phytanoyl-CoA dioxygenase n=1 Tax=Periconia macrospinosa TaxID=97972 RepID=A0A2V1DGJ8_9PLEO|nr:phytanoyl-CoA dioxygenase [Periconia macrospinosa]